MEDKISQYKFACSKINQSCPPNEFVKYILNAKTNKSQIENIIKTCKVDLIHCRFNLWRLLLNVIHFDHNLNEITQAIKKSRQLYSEHKKEANAPIFKKQQNPIKNPLMKKTNKPQTSKQSQAQAFLREQIQKDVDRCYQQISIFQNVSINKLMTRILFIWCRINSQISYRQGMHELLASIIYVYFQQTSLQHPKQQLFENKQQHQLYQYMNSIQYAQSDIYIIFMKVMNIHNEMFKTQTIKQINPKSTTTPIIQRITQIQSHKLKQLDIQLFRLIRLQNILTNSFLLRWIKCMHTREFTLENSFLIWDSIFLQFALYQQNKQKPVFEFIDAMCIAMLIYMRSIVLNKDSAYQIQQIYQKYPPLKKGQYLQELITLAWSVCDELRQNKGKQVWGDINNNKDQKIQKIPIKETQIPQQNNIMQKNKHQSHQSLSEMVQKSSQTTITIPLLELKQIIKQLNDSYHNNDKNKLDKVIKTLENKLKKQ